MATRTNLPASEIQGTPLDASWLNDLRGAFRILQVVQGSTTTVASSASSTYIDTTLSASITPQSSSSLILCLVSQNIYTNNAGTGALYRVMRGATVLDTYVDLSFGTASGIVCQHQFSVLDTPASTSALTYKTMFARNLGVGTVYCQVNANPARMTLLEVSA